MTTEKKLLAGAGRADITPEMGIQIAGDIGRYRPVEEIKDRLQTKALVVSDGEQTACLVSSDLTSIQRDWADKLRAQIAEYLEIDPGAVILHATQSHSAPAVGNGFMSDDYAFTFPEGLDWIRGGDARYNEVFVAGAMAAVKAAHAGMRPAALKAVRGYDTRVGTNRRYISRGDKGICQAQRDNPNILCWEGPVDPEVGVAVLEDESGRAMAALLHYTCHPCHGYPKRWISADWPGYWATKMEEHFGGGCVALVLNGACGNILHGNPFDTDHKGGIEVKGGYLVETAVRVLARIETLAGAPVVCGRKVLPIPLRKTGADIIAAARKLLAEHPEPMWKDEAKTSIDWKWVHAHCILDNVAQKKANPSYAYEVQIFRIGDLAVIGWPGEPFVEAQLEVKKKAPAKYVFLAHMCNDSPGYQPTRKAFKYGGYEVEWTDFDENTLDTVTSETKSLLNAVYVRTSA
ncbi:MAG: neutral/alkaline non-lysosomal ceramidase N-terminal domain-containing protein [Kiritimatiellae bacterium]|nr:neutral/alkaline non-lysosomal ceramidase N-terminal domain-containing protein [Kiritimatiellia bacterium]